MKNADPQGPAFFCRSATQAAILAGNGRPRRLNDFAAFCPVRPAPPALGLPRRLCQQADSRGPRPFCPRTETSPQMARGGVFAGSGVLTPPGGLSARIHQTERSRCARVRARGLRGRGRSGRRSPLGHPFPLFSCPVGPCLGRGASTAGRPASHAPQHKPPRRAAPDPAWQAPPAQPPAGRRQLLPGIINKIPGNSWEKSSPPPPKLRREAWEKFARKV